MNFVAVEVMARTDNYRLFFGEGKNGKKGMCGLMVDSIDCLKGNPITGIQIFFTGNMGVSCKFPSANSGNDGQVGFVS